MRDVDSGGNRPIEVSGLHKTYGTRGGEVEALRDVSFDIKAGEFISLVGPSGCGKSTVLKILAGLIPDYEGTALVGGQKAAPGRRDTGIMLQSPVLLPWRTVLSNILLPTEIFGLDKKTAKARARELIELTGLAGFADKYSWELSGGMQQRVNLARLLVLEPEILFLDEPFAALDEFTRERLNVELMQIQEGSNRTAMYVTHNILEAVFLSDRVVVMKAQPGEIVEIVDVDLPRPRRREMFDDKRTFELVAHIRERLYSVSGEGMAN